MHPTHIHHHCCAAAALAVTALTLFIPSSHAAPVWNVNIGGELTPGDNFVGAAPENTANSTWNSLGSTNLLPLVDSTGAAGTATIQLGVVGGTLGFTGNGGYLPEIFTTWCKETTNTLPVAVNFGGLTPSATYDLIVYADWYWQGGAGVPITQTTGTGMSGTVTLNNFNDAFGTVHALVQDTDLGNNNSIRGNWLRITGLTPSAGGILGFNMNGRNAPLSGFQLIQMTTGITDTTPPTLDVFLDNKGGGPVVKDSPVTYTLTFSEAMNPSTVDAADFENASTAAITVNSVVATANPAEFLVTVTPTTSGTLRLKVAAGAILKDLAGNDLVTTPAVQDDTLITVVADTTAPTVASIVDDKSGGPIIINQTVTYTVTFDEAMNASTVDASDFENASLAATTIGSVTATANPAVFLVEATPTAAGDLQLQIKAGATIEDLAGNALNTTSAIPDNNIIDVNLPPQATVWNVNIGGEIDSSDNFFGAAPENTVNSTWNSVFIPNPTNQALLDSTGGASTVTLTLTPGAAGISYGGYAPVTGLELFSTWIKSSDNATPFTMTIGGLSTSPGVTYDLIVYSDWKWKGNDYLPLTQTVGSGLTGTVYLDQISTGTEGVVPALVEDTNLAQNGAVEGNWIRINGLTPDGSGSLGFLMGGRNAAFNGFQLVQAGTGAPDNTPPTPNPMTWSSAPAAASSSSITMTATTASDPSGVEYFFDETSGNPGGTDSGWQSSPVYTDTGLSPSTSYTYTVRARDKSALNNQTAISGAASATTNPPPSGAVVWNVNIGSQVTTADNYAGAVPQSTPINWNSITTSSYTGLALKDSTGSTAGGITLDLTSDRAPGNAALTSGDKIFIEYFGGAGASSSMALRGLTVTKTYDILFYSDWAHKSGEALPITQTAGTGLTGTFYLNRILTGAGGTVPALTPDTNPANVTSGTGNLGNYCRIVGIVPDNEGKVSFRIGDGANTAFSGFQLVQTGDVTPRADMLSLSLASNPPSIRDGVFSGTNITLTVPYGTDVTNLAPTFTLWPGATCVPASGTARNFTTPQTYTVTSSDSLITKPYLVTVVNAPPLPEFTLTAPANWDGRSTITVQPNITNLALLQANNGTNFTYNWSTSGIAVTQTTSPGVMTLTRSQGSGVLTITLTLNNGTENVTRSTTVNVTEPATDPWVERTPGATEKPVNGQFFARNPNTNLGTIHYNGTQGGTPDSVYLKVYRTPSGGAESLFARHDQALVSGAYTFAAPVPAGLFTYRVVYGTRTGVTDTDVATVTNLVCGDAYIIEGQSNAVSTDNSEPQVDTSYPWIYTYNPTLGWGPAYAKPTSPKWDSKIGFWGMRMAQQIVANHQMPVCIINGAVGGTRIDQHQPNPANHTVGAGTYDIYANLLNRVIAAKLTHGIRGIFWHQGESDSGNAGPILDYDYTTYQQNFLNMSAAWKQDYPNFQRYLIFQVMPKPCGMGPKGDQLREVLRTLPFLYSKMSILNTLGLAGYEGCHFSKTGYDNMADRILPVVYRDFYGVTPGGPVTAPNLKRAYFTSPARTAIALEFDQPVSWSSFSTPNYFVDDVGGKVTSGSASGNIVTLQLNAAASANATLDYLKDDIWDQNAGSLLYGANGIPALTFADVPVATLTPYELWSGGSFANAFTDTAATSDPDHDDMTNQEEFAFGLDPTTGSSVNPITQQLAGSVFKYTRTKNSGLTYKIYYSTDLSGWTWDEFATQSPAAAVGGVETVTVTLAAAAPSNGRLFVRVEATPTP